DQAPGDGVGVVAQLLHHPPDPLLGGLADAGMIGDDPGDRGRRNPRGPRHIRDGHAHNPSPRRTSLRSDRPNGTRAPVPQGAERLLPSPFVKFSLMQAEGMSKEIAEIAPRAFGDRGELMAKGWTKGQRTASRDLTWFLVVSSLFIILLVA